MVNIWDYKDSNKVIIKTVDGESYSGKVITITDASEYEEETAEDDITIQVSPGNNVSFCPFEIESIVEIS